MAAICSLALQPTAQSWETRDNSTAARGSNIYRAPYGCSISSKTCSGRDSLHHKHQHHLPPNGSRSLDGVSAPEHAVPNKFRQIKPSPDINKDTSFVMTAKHGQSAPILNLKRSFSTPAERTMADSATAAGEKKRNKLGYHRTSIACSHCRRRKIRCIVSPEMQNRCINCIRLKKDCSFFPVDQQSGADSQGKPASQGNGSSTAQSQSPSPALGPGLPVAMASGSMYGTGTMQDAMGQATPVTGYSSVAGEGLGMPIPADQNFTISSEPSLAWGSAEPRPVAMPGPMDMAYGWRPYGSVSSSTEAMSPFGPGSTTSSTWMAATAATPQLHDWNWDGMPPTMPGRSVSFSGELLGHPPPAQMVPVPSNAPPYNRGGSNAGNPFSSPMSHAAAPGLHHLPSQAGDPNGNWQPQHQMQQQMLQQQQQQQQQMASFEPWGMPHVNGPHM